jgi:hypothetical protein
MKRNHAPLSNQSLLSFTASERIIDDAMLGPNARPRSRSSIHNPLDGPNTGSGHPLADARRSRLSGLQHDDGEAWFLPVDANDTDPEPEPEPKPVPRPV